MNPNPRRLAPFTRRLASLAVLAVAAGIALPVRADEKTDRRPTVAVLYFDYTGKDEQMGVLRKGLAQMLISDLAAVDAVRIVERDRLQQLLDEQKLGQSGKIDPATAARVGKLLGARYMVMGGYFDLLGALRADARLVEVETGKIVHSAGANGRPDDFLGVEQKLAESLSGKLGTLLAMAPGTPPSNMRVAPPARPRPKAPAKLATRVAVQYAKALDLLDQGKKPEAQAQLKEVVKAQPDFQLASLDLDRLVQ